MIGQVDDGPAKVPLALAPDIEQLHIDTEVVRLAGRIAATRNYDHVVGILLMTEMLREIIALVFADRHTCRILEDNRGTHVHIFLRRVHRQGFFGAAPVKAQVHLECVGLVPARVIRFRAIIGFHHADALAPVDTAEPPALFLAEGKFITEGIRFRRSELVRQHELLGAGFFVRIELRHKRIEVILRLVVNAHGRIVIVKDSALAIFRRKEPRGGRFDLAPARRLGRRVIEVVKRFLVGIHQCVQVLQVITAIEFERLGIVEVDGKGRTRFHAKMFRCFMVVETHTVLQQVIRRNLPGILYKTHMVEGFLYIGHGDGRHLFLVTFIVVFQFITEGERMVRDAAVVQPLLGGERVEEHLDGHEVANFHGLVELAVCEGHIVVPVAVDAVRDVDGDSDVAPVHVERVKAQAVLADVEAELQAGIVRDVVHERALQIRKLVIEIQIHDAQGVHQVEHVADVGGTAGDHPAGRALVAFGMGLSRERTYLDARLAEPFVDGVLATGAAVHLEHGTQAVAVLRREPALVELHVVDSFHEERTEEAEEMHRGIHDRVVEQEEVLVGGATAHVNLGTEIGTGDHARERLHALDHVGFGETGHALDGLCGNDGFAGLALGALAQLHHDFLELGDLVVVAAGKKRVDIDVFRLLCVGGSGGIRVWILRLRLRSAQDDT